MFPFLIVLIAKILPLPSSSSSFVKFFIKLYFTIVGKNLRLCRKMSRRLKRRHLSFLS